MNVFDLYAKITLDSKGFDSDLKSAESKFSGFANGIKSAASAIGDVLSAMAKGTAVAIGAASTAVTGLVKSSLDQYANYEQLVGGVDKIFGESSKKVQEYANEAYKTAGLSANEYMETVTSFSASLMQGLKGDTEATADVADRAIRDMADNANTYGTDMQSIQNAYMGFSKQNYTMLDNLKLGYGGTKEEMKRLIKDASQMTTEMKELGVSVDADSMSFDNIINAISVMQQHLKISGTTAKEASATITGSVGSMKAAWKNFLTGTGSPQQFVDSLVGSIGNISRQLKNIVPRLVEGLKGLATALAPELPKMLMEILPTIIDGAVSLLTTVAEMLPDMIDTLLPPLIHGVVLIMSALIQNLPQILRSFADALPVVLTTLMENSGGLVKAGKDMLGMIADGLKSASKNIGPAIGNLVEKIGDFLTNTDAIMKCVRFAGEIIDNLVSGLFSKENLEKIVSNAPAILDKIGEGVVEAIKVAGNALADIVENIIDYLFGENSDEHWADLITGAAKIIQWIGEGCLEILKTGLNILDRVARGIFKALGLEEAYDKGKQFLKDFGQGVYEQMLSPGWRSFWEGLGETLYDWFHPFTDNTGREQKIAEEYNNAYDPSMMNEYESADSVRETFRGGSYDKANDAALYAAQFNAKGVPIFGNGGIVTKPTFALIGEDGAEAVVPLEKDSEVGRKFGGSTYNVTVNMTVNASALSDIENAGDEMIRIIDTRLRQYQVQQVRGQGGTAW